MDADELYELLPAIYRLRDAAAGEPLRALVAVLAEQATAIEEDLNQLYDDQFIETAAPWAVPYIGDLIGYRSLHGLTAAIASPRAEVANTIAYRRRKGTAAMLEQLARDVTGWDARVVEFFQLLATTQYMNHLRPGNLASPHLRAWRPLADIGTPFDAVAHTADVRRISRRRGRFNIPNIGIFLWRIAANSHTRSPAVALDARRFHVSPHGAALPLYNRPEAEAVITQLAGPANVPAPLSRRRLREELAQHYGPGAAIFIERAGVDGDGRFDPAAPLVPVPVEEVLVCNLQDVPDGAGGTSWAHTPVPAGRVAIDPVLGRIASGDDETGMLLVTYHYGSAGPLGGGEYERAATFEEELEPVVPVAMPGPLQAALTGETHTIEVRDSGRYAENLSINLAAGQRVEVRAANGAFPTAVLTADFAVFGDDGSELTINGLCIAGGALRVGGTLRRLRLVHCTFVPGLALGADGAPGSPGTPSLHIEWPGTAVEIDHCILGGIRAHPDATVTIRDSIVDANGPGAIAYAGLDDASPGAPLTLFDTTVVGRAWARELPEATNTIFLAALPDPADPAWPYPVRVDQRQAGCVRFSYVPPGSRVPRRYHCQPAEDADAARVRPQFTSLRFGTPAYGQLSLRCAPEITTGAEDGSEMGAFHDNFAPQRETNLRVRLDEYLRFGLEAGIFFAS
ncbi:MAG: hypothetical protein IT303_00190 [Dehalococcoidia bacterium]|nr:hypothetical protein [Dehalococcoidia bacterium]